MKNKLKFIIIVILIVIIISFIAIYVIYKNSMTYKVGIIIYKEGENIILKNSVDTTAKSCAFSTKENATIKDINGKKINFSDLNVGDTIKILYKKKMKSISVYPETIENIKLIQVIEDNSDGHLTEYDLSYNDFLIYGITFEKDSIRFTITTADRMRLDKIPNDYSSTECSIVEKADNVKYIDSDAILSNKLQDGSVKITINVPNLTEGMDKGKYVFKFSNKELGLIKIPFEINQSGTLQW